MCVSSINGSEMDILLNSDRYSNRQQADSDDAQSLEKMQSYLLETLFLKPFSEHDGSILTEEEREQMGDSKSKEMQQAMMTRTFAQKLAKEDILGFEKIYLKPKGGTPVPKDVPDAQRMAPYRMGSLAE